MPVFKRKLSWYLLYYILVMLSTCCPVRFVMRSTLGQQQQNLGLGLTIIRPVLERIQGFLLRVETRMIFYIDIFLGPGHHGLEDVSIQLIDRVSGEESALRDKEGQWAYRLNCIQPQGLNISDFFYNQNRSTRSRVR